MPILLRVAMRRIDFIVLDTNAGQKVNQFASFYRESSKKSAFVGVKIDLIGNNDIKNRIASN